MSPREEVLYRYWERTAITGCSFSCIRGQRVVVVSRGERNVHAGPDYRGAVLIIDGNLCVGAVEMHVDERDWYSHSHHLDPAYDAVILHVVLRVSDTVHLEIPTLVPNDVDSNDTESPKSKVVAQDVGLTTDVIAECSWNRLIRRSTEVLRSDNDLSLSTRLRRWFVRQMFDCLGYHNNRDTMGLVANAVLSVDSDLRGRSFDEIVRLVVAVSDMDTEHLIALGRSFMPDHQLNELRLVPRLCNPIPWRYNTRPSNYPVRRLWAASKLLFDIYNFDLVDSLVGNVYATASVTGCVGHVSVRLGSEQFIGEERALDIVINVVLPVALAWASSLRDSDKISGVLNAYYSAPTLGSNDATRSVESSYNTGRMSGAFWQQGAIEFRQRFKTADKSHISFVAENHGGDFYH